MDRIVMLANQLVAELESRTINTQGYTDDVGTLIQIFFWNDEIDITTRGGTLIFKNYCDLPPAAIEFANNVESINQLAIAVEGVYDFDNPEQKISEVYYDKDADKVFCKFEEEKQ